MTRMVTGRGSRAELVRRGRNTLAPPRLGGEDGLEYGERVPQRSSQMVEDLVDERRTEPPFLLADREMLDAWLEFHRTTLLLKCEGLDDAQLKARPVPTSELSLHGLVRHMAEVERNWFSRVLLSAPQTPFIWADPNVESSELLPLDDADWAADLAAWQAECETSRHNAAGKDLSVTGQGYGEPVSLRWIYVHMIEEYARHNGHADLIRELVDGAVGW
jgi:uncharacterized damage-inducible protein DinB